MKQYILTGIKRGTAIASIDTINSEICTDKEFMSYTWMSSSPTFFTDMLSQADKKGRAYWMSDDEKYLFMLKKI